jgi:molybdopterin-guanine dinucleotide biosynthesis protein
VKIIAVAGTGSGCGKTTVACRILRAIPGLGAVKISPREGLIRIEWGAGAPGKDTDLYVNSGAVRVARIICPREAVGEIWELVKAQFQDCPGVVIEGASALGILGERLVIFVVGESHGQQREERNRAIAAKSTVIIDRSSHFDENLLFDEIRAFLSIPSKKEC